MIRLFTYEQMKNKVKQTTKAEQDKEAKQTTSEDSIEIEVLENIILAANLRLAELSNPEKPKEEIKEETIDEEKIIKEAVQVFGSKHQIEKAIEECAELIVELQRLKTCRNNNVPEEIADVEIMMSQLRHCFIGVEEIKKKKLKRLAGLTKSKKEENKKKKCNKSS